MRLWCWCVVALAACTKPNPAVCCLDEADCASIGVSDPERTCAEGLACVNNACVVPSCSTDGCSAEAPVCDIGLDVCTGCTGPTDCDQFDTKVCDTGSGACVECVEATDCSASTPVCDDGVCRTCALDSECESGACGDDGLCIDEAQIIYMEVGGANAGTCGRSAPCSEIEYAITQASIARSHLVYAPGTYLEPTDVDITLATTSAPSLTLHGHGATISGSGEDTIGVAIPTTFRDVIVLNTGAGRALSTESSGIVLERVKIVSGGTGLTVGGSVTARAVTIEARFNAISLFNGGALDLDGATLSSEVESVVDAGLATPTSILMKNALIFGTTDIGVSLQSTQGALEFVTITNVGSTSPNSTAGLQCSAALAVRNSIVWTPLVGKSPITGGCNLTNVMAGPMAVVGAANQDPLFVNAAAADFHLGPNSPARDASNTGPAFDFEGDPRPQGMRFDLGADESE